MYLKLSNGCTLHTNNQKHTLQPTAYYFINAHIPHDNWRNKRPSREVTAKAHQPANITYTELKLPTKCYPTLHHTLKRHRFPLLHNTATLTTLTDKGIRFGFLHPRDRNHSGMPAPSYTLAQEYPAKIKIHGDSSPS
jgi:hypothetical protein